MRIKVVASADSRFGTNSYVVIDEETKDAVVIDAHLEPDLIVEQVKEEGCNVKAIILTHTDLDHIGGLATLMHEWPGVPVAVHGAEREVITEAKPLRRSSPVEFEKVADPLRLVEGETLSAGSLEFRVLHTPGHSPGGVSLLIDGVVFTGDALFAGSVGRTDFHNSDTAALMTAIKDKLLALPDETLVYSGHGPVTTIGQERRYNPFLG